MQHLISFAGSPLIPPETKPFLLVGGIVLTATLAFLVFHFRDRYLTVGHKLREILIWLFFLVLGTSVFLGYIFLKTPGVILISPAIQSLDVDPKTKIEISFDRPVARKVLNEKITPSVAGTWVYEDPVYSTHLYRKLVFYPDTTLNAGTKYKVELNGIENTFGTSSPYNYEFTFSTKSDPVIAKQVAMVESQTVKLDVPMYLQQHTLSCEVASLRMALAYKGINKSEDELLNEVEIDNTPHIDGTWGNPYLHFVGNVNGNQMRDGYGVYWGPIERVAKMYGDAKAFQNGKIQDLTSEIDKGNPIVIWVYSESGAPAHWKTPDGTDVFAVAGEHTVVVVGYVGSSQNPTQIIVNDSLVGQSYWGRDYFNHKWATFSEAGVVVYK